MTTRLTDTERALLSAYRDDEVSLSEKAEAERLLAESDEAREYLGDLRSINAFSHVAYPAVDAVGVGAGAGLAGKLTSSAIRDVANGAAHTGIGAGWYFGGLAAAAVTTLVVWSGVLDGSDRQQPARAAVSAAEPSTQITRLGLAVDASSLMVPTITRQELIDFAVTGCLPIDSSRGRYLTVDAQSEGMEITVHDAPSRPTTGLSKVDLGAVAGLDSIEGALRTSLLQSEDRGIAVRADLPKLRLRILAELKQAADGLPATLQSTRRELEREYERLSSELRRSSLNARREHGESQVRYLLISGRDLRKGSESAGPGSAVTFAPTDRRVQMVHVSRTMLGSLAALVERPRPAAAAQHADARFDVASIQQPRVSARTPGVISRHATAVARDGQGIGIEIDVQGDSLAVPYQQIRLLQLRNQTLDRYFNASEDWIDEAQEILQMADSIRQRIRILRQESESQVDIVDFVDEEGATEAPNGADQPDAVISAPIESGEATYPER